MLRDAAPLFLSLMLLVLSCQESSTTGTAFRGKTMGTFYEVLSDQPITHLQSQVDSVLVKVNQSFSTYIPESTISLINQNRNDQILADREFEMVFYKARAIYGISEGAFDPTVMPLINYWGFGPKSKRPVTKVDSQKVSELLQYSRFDSCFIKKNPKGVARMSKYHARTQLDLSAIAKGHGVDRVSSFLDAKGVKNYMVNIGGEVRAKGKKKDGNSWRIGINTPKSESALDEYELVVGLDNLSMATSGNYRNFHEIDGQKYAHTLNPKTGYPTSSNLLSASIFSASCMDADAFSTACMAMGFERAKAMIEKEKSIEGILLYGKADGTIACYSSAGAPKPITQN